MTIGQFMTGSQLIQNHNETYEKSDAYEQIVRDREEQNQYDESCQFGMKEATDGLCYYTPDEDWNWPETFRDHNQSTDDYDQTSG